MRPPLPQAVVHERPDRRGPRRFARSDYDRPAADVSADLFGERNSLLFWGACKLRELVEEGAIGLDEACDELMLVAEEVGLSRKEAERTIASGMRGS